MCEQITKTKHFFFFFFGKQMHCEFGVKWYSGSFIVLYQWMAVGWTAEFFWGSQSLSQSRWAL